MLILYEWARKYIEAEESIKKPFAYDRDNILVKKRRTPESMESKTYTLEFLKLHV